MLENEEMKKCHLHLFQTDLTIGSKEFACKAGNLGPVPGLGRSGGGHGNPLQYSCRENSMDRGAWRATLHGVTESETTEQLTLTHMQ